MNFSRRINSPWIAGPISGFLLVLSFPMPGLFPLAFGALIPFLAYVVRRPEWLKLLAGHYLFGVVFFTFHLYWIPNVLTSFGGFPFFGALPALLALSLLMATLLLPFSVLTRIAAGHSPELALLCAPGFWVLTELVRSYFPAQGFPWGLLGSSQVPFVHLVQIADLSGVFAVSYLVVMANAVGVACFLRLESAQRLGVIAAVFVGAALSYGIYRVHFWAPPRSDSVRVGLIQPDVGLSAPREHYARKYFQELNRLYSRAVEEGAVWVIVSEAQNPYLYGRDYYYTSYWKRKTTQSGVPLLFNSVLRDRSGDAFNSALQLDGRGRLDFRYDKIRLVPFGEYVPWERLLNVFFSPLVRGVAGFAPGREVTRGRIEGRPFGVLICFESVFPQAGRAVARARTEMIVNMSNDSWYGDSAAPTQLLEMTRLRAVETRKPILRAANSGWTALIDPWGRIEAILPRSKADVLVVDVAGVPGDTLYSMIGEWLNILLVAGCCATLASLVKWSPTSWVRFSPGGRKAKRRPDGDSDRGEPSRSRRRRGPAGHRLFGP